MKKLFSIFYLILFSFTFANLFAYEIQVGIGNQNTKIFPVQTNFDYNYTQQIYSKNYISYNGGKITKLSFYYEENNIANSTDWVIYMGNTDKYEFNSKNDWVPIDSLFEVYSGNIYNFLSDNDNSGWMTIELSNPFNYDNNKNLVIAIDENTIGHASGGGMQWSGFNDGRWKGLSYSSNSNNPDPVNPPEAESRRNIINIIKLEFSLPPGIPILNLPQNGAIDVNIRPIFSWIVPEVNDFYGLSEGYKLYIKTEIDEEYAVYDINNIAEIDTIYYEFTTLLNYNTTYYWTVSSYNSIGEGETAPVRYFVTLSLPALTWVKCLTTPNSNVSIDLEWSYDTNNPPAYINIWALDYSEINGVETHPYPYYDPVNLINEDIIVNDINPYIDEISPLGWKKIARIPTSNHLTVNNYIFPEMVRGYYYFTLFAESNNGQMSDVPEEPFYRESLSYWPGDVIEECGIINANDINILSLTWGANQEYSQNWNPFCDVGPTLDRSRRSRPMPDGVINIEDLMIFAMNYNNTNYDYYPRNIPEIQPITISMNSQNIGEKLIVSLVLGGNNGFVKVLDIPLAYGNGLQLLSVERGEVWSENGLILYTNKDRIITLSWINLDTNDLIQGNGIIANLIFSIIGNDTSLELGHMTARSCENEDIEIINNPTGDTDNEDSVNIIPVDSYLSKVYPNPFNPSTTLQYGIKETGQVKISVFNARGQLIRTLVNQNKIAGTYQIVWDGKDNNGNLVSSGVYFFYIETKKEIKRIKGLLIK